MPYVYSTLTADQEYAIYPKKMDAKSIPNKLKSFIVKGQSNVIDKETLITPRGAVTELSAEDLTELETIPAFKNHRSLGFITVDGKVTAKQGDPDKVAKSMTTKDRSAQLTAENFEPDKAPKVNKDG